MTEQSKNTKENRGLLRAYSLVTPVLLVIIGYLTVSKLDSIDDRLANLEGLPERVAVIETKLELNSNRTPRATVPTPKGYAILQEPIKLKEEK